MGWALGGNDLYEHRSIFVATSGIDDLFTERALVTLSILVTLSTLVTLSV